MKKVLITLMTLVMMLSLVACGGNSGGGSNDSTAVDSKTEMVMPLDLTGLWVQEGKSEDETHMVATIREDGLIGVFFILEDDPEPWTYWVGTYEKPTDDKDSYSWTSESTYGGNGMLASSDSTKDFNYKKGKLTYKVSIQGETSTVTLVKGEWDSSLIPESAFGSVNSATTDVKPLEIAESGWYVNNDYLFYYVKIHNPNEDVAIELPSFRVTARDDSGAVIDTTDQTLSVIYPGKDFYYGSQGFSVDAEPSTVDFEMLPGEDYNLKRATSEDYKDLEVVNTSAKNEKFVGEINNPNDYDLDSVVVIAVCKDASGNVTRVEMTFVDGISANGSAPFSISYWGDVDTSNVSYYANQW